jgi:hypothetical protein
MGEGDVLLALTNGTPGSSNDIGSVNTWRQKMQNLTTQSMMTMQYVPQFDRKLLRYGVSSIVAIIASTIGVVAYA